MSSRFSRVTDCCSTARALATAEALRSTWSMVTGRIFAMRGGAGSYPELVSTDTPVDFAGMSCFCDVLLCYVELHG